LKKRYGGEIVLHGPDSSKFNPHSQLTSIEIRKKYNLPSEVPMLLFAGKPVFYNGLPKLIEVLKLDSAKEWHLTLVGNLYDPIFQNAKEQLGDRCHLLGYVQNELMPEILHMCDVVPILQSEIPSTNMQIPAKLLEAMAMAKAIIATDVSDLKSILSKDCGWIVDLDNILEIAELLNELSQNKEEISRRGQNARQFYLQNASIEVIQSKLIKILK
jgi:glycosyltransferase involved in cell wall biosynthesis